MSGKFEIYKDREGKYRFRLKDGQNDILLTGEAYESREACRQGVESVKRNAGEAGIREIE